MSLVDVIVVTWNLPQYAVPCVNSILRDIDAMGFAHVYVVNNGEPAHADYFPKSPLVTVLNQDKNLGWEGGLKAGLAHSIAPYVVFMNDDTYIPPSSSGWLKKMAEHFVAPDCGAVGPSSNVVMGSQQIFQDTQTVTLVNFLIGFCLMVRRQTLDEVGGIDDTLPGGDDLDLSYRIRKAGKFLVCDKRVFVYHHGFKSGERLHGNSSQKDGWNSLGMIERTNFGLINKHGLRGFMDIFNGNPWDPDEEGHLIRQMVDKTDKTLDLGCGGRKTVPWAIGVDMLQKGADVPNVYPKAKSVADVIGDVTQPLPFEPDSQDVLIARHVLEHVPDVAKTVANWANVLRHGGRLILAVPDEKVGYTKDLDHDHKQTFTKESLVSQMESLGWKTVGVFDPRNKVSMVGVFQKNGLH